jgi:hypothetical protein
MARHRPGEIVVRKPGACMIGSASPLYVYLLDVPSELGCCCCDDDDCHEWDNCIIVSGEYVGEYMCHVSECQTEDFDGPGGHKSAATDQELRRALAEHVARMPARTADEERWMSWTFALALLADAAAYGLMGDGWRQIADSVTTRPAAVPNVRPAERFADPPPECDECGAEVVMPHGSDCQRTLFGGGSRLACAGDATHDHGVGLGAVSL